MVKKQDQAGQILNRKKSKLRKLIQKYRAFKDAHLIHHSRREKGDNTYHHKSTNRHPCVARIPIIFDSYY
jgi:hypothetical protein